jgi:riboflavin biosynthesis pyrimidine reductase
VSVEFTRLFARPASQLQPAAPATAGGVIDTAAPGLGRVSLEEFLDELWEMLTGARASGGTTPASPDGEAGSARPYVLLNMISTADGRATIAGRSGPLGGTADHALFHGLRTLVDAVLVGARTLRVERYNRIVNDAAERARRSERGLAAEALACVVSGSLELDPAIPLLADPEARVVIVTPSQASLEPVAAQVQYVRCASHGELDLSAALHALRERLRVGTVLCEGGPHLAWQLLEAGLLDEMFLTLAPRVAGGDIASSPVGTRGMTVEDVTAGAAALPLMSGAPFSPPAQLDLLSALESDSYLFLRYRVAR